MFSKFLLLLAICFQALHTGNSVVHREKIKGGWQIGKSVNVKMEDFTHEHPNCKMEFQDKNGDSGDCLFISLVGTYDRFLINTYINGKWQSEDNDYKIDIRRENMNVDVVAEKEGFKITFKGKEYFRKYDFPLENIRQMKVDCPSESGTRATITWHKECKCKS